MNFKKKLRILFEYMTNTHILRNLPHGVNQFHDISKFLQNYRVDIVIDVGANIGQSTEQFLSCFPNARIFCFEPVKKTYHQLLDNLKGQARVESFQLALGSKEVVPRI